MNAASWAAKTAFKIFSYAVGSAVILAAATKGSVEIQIKNPFH